MPAAHLILSYSTAMKMSGGFFLKPYCDPNNLWKIHFWGWGEQKDCTADLSGSIMMPLKLSYPNRTLALSPSKVSINCFRCCFVNVTSLLFYCKTKQAFFKRRKCAPKFSGSIYNPIVNIVNTQSLWGRTTHLILLTNCVHISRWRTGWERAWL